MFACSFEDNLTVRAGSSLSFAGGQSIKVDKLIMHESYVYGFDFNIAMLKLARALKFNRNTKPIRLARFRPKDGAIAVVSGFGMRNVRLHHNRLIIGIILSASCEIPNLGFDS